MTLYADRRAALRASLDEAGLDALFIGSAANRRYLTGFVGSAGYVLIGRETDELLVDGRYVTQARVQAPDINVRFAGTQPQQGACERITELGLRKVGFEALQVTVARLDKFQEHAPEVEWISTRDLVENLRAAKAPVEIEALRRAVAVSDGAIAHAYAMAAPGMTEAELAWRLEVWMREHGAEKLAFDIIVAAGENSSRPHHHPSQRPLRAGEPITIDLGAVVEGYHSDVTRTFSIGPVIEQAEEYDRVWHLVDRARQAAIAALQPGVSGKQADQAARDPITAAGHGEHFGHGTGHGVGLEIHEGPRLSKIAPETPLPVGCAVTVEPGVYLPERFGVRIEDLVVLGPDGAEVLTQVANMPVVMPATTAAMPQRG